MLINRDKLQLVADIAKQSGFGSMVAVYNDIEKIWYYYIGDFKPANPSNHIHFNSISGKCINYILENEFTYFRGELAKSELIYTKLEDLPKEDKVFDFKYVWFR